MLIDKFTGEILSDLDEKLVIAHGGLYSAFPIPAYQVLVRDGNHAAKDVLLCLVSHLHLGSNVAWPSYTTIAKEAKKGRETVSKALKDLNDYGFVRTFTWQVTQKKKRNKYYLDKSCYNHSLMGEKARAGMPKITSCQYCGKGLTEWEFEIRDGVFAHWGCSGGMNLPKARFTLKGEPTSAA